MLNYHHLRYFLVVAREGSVTRAAELLNVAQASISIQLKQLEDYLGQPLFLRQGRNLVLSEAGQMALDYAELIFRTGDELLDVIKHQISQKKQIVRVGAVATLSRNFQMQLLHPLFKREKLGVFLHSGNMKDLLAMLGSHLLDLVLSNLPAHREPDFPWYSHLIDTQQVSLIGKFDEIDAKQFKFPRDLECIPLILPSQDSNYRSLFDLVLEKHKITPLIAAEVDDMAMLRLLAIEGGGLALVPRVVVHRELHNGTVHEYHRFRDIKESFYAITLDRQHPNEYIEEILKPFLPG